MSIIFYLNSDLKVYTADQFVNDQELQIQEVGNVAREAGEYLNLFDKFEFLWADLLENMEFDKVYFLIGPKAGFTDTRIVFIWLKSWVLFNLNYVYFVSRTETDPLFLSQNEIAGLLKRIEGEDQKDLVYSKEPKIGKAK